MFTFINPVEHYIKEIRVPCKLDPSERATTTLPFVFESRTNSRVQSPRDPEVITTTSPAFPLARRNVPPVKRQLHRELVYYFGRNKEFTKNKEAEKYYKELHSLGPHGMVECNEYNDLELSLFTCRNFCEFRERGFPSTIQVLNYLSPSPNSTEAKLN